MGKIWLVIFLISIFFISPVFSQNQKLNIQAESITYDQTDSSTDAENISRFTFSGYTGNCGRLHYSAAENKIAVETGYSLFWDRCRLTGDYFNFDIKKNTGQSGPAVFTLGQLKLSGEKVIFSDREVTLEKASFTTCDLQPPHFELVASKILVYPDRDLMISQWNVLKIFDLPVAFLPAYILSSSWLGLVTENQTLLPEVSYDRINGLKIEERAGFFINENFTGTIDFGYSGRRKFILGATTGYQLNASNGGSLKIHYYTDGEWSGNLQHQIVLGGDTSSTSFSRLFYHGQSPVQEPLATATFQMSKGEILNNFQVSQLPRLTVQSGKFSLPLGARFQGQIELGKTRQENDVLVESSLAVFNGRIFYQQADVLGPLYEAALETQLTRFDRFPDWRWARIILGHRLVGYDFFQSYLGYNHYFYKFSENPFSYQETIFRPNDLLTIINRLTMGPVKFGLNYYYDLTQKTAADIDYQADLDLHCLTLSLKWKSLRSELVVGLGLKVF